MSWVITLTLANGETDTLYCVSREEARERARFYRTMCDPSSERRVIRASVGRAA